MDLNKVHAIKSGLEFHPQPFNRESIDRFLIQPMAFDRSSTLNHKFHEFLVFSDIEATSTALLYDGLSRTLNRYLSQPGGS